MVSMSWKTDNLPKFIIDDYILSRIDSLQQVGYMPLKTN